MSSSKSSPSAWAATLTILLLPTMAEASSRPLDGASPEASPDPGIEPDASDASPDPSVAEPSEPTPSEPTPSEPTPSEPTPSEPTPSKPAPVEPAPRPHPLAHATEQAAREHAYEQEFEIPPAPAVPNPPGRQNIFNRPIKSFEWDAMEIINTDRPDFTDVLPTVKKYMWQTESGYSFSMRERGGESPYSYFRHRVPETLIRYGLTERLELRMRWDSAFYTHRTGSANLEPGGVAFSGEFTVGVKWQAILQDGWKPAHSFMAILSARGSDGNVTHTGFEPGLNWIYGWQVRKFMVLRGSTGFEYVAQLAQPSDGDPPIGTLGSLTMHQSVVTYLQWLPQLGSYSEWFSFYDFGYDRGAQQNLGQGFYIYLTPNVQLDLRVAGTVAAFGDRFRDLTVGGGLSLRGFYHRQRRVPNERASKEQSRAIIRGSSLANVERSRYDGPVRAGCDCTLDSVGDGRGAPAARPSDRRSVRPAARGRASEPRLGRRCLAPLGTQAHTGDPTRLRERGRRRAAAERNPARLLANRRSGGIRARSGARLRRAIVASCRASQVRVRP